MTKSLVLALTASMLLSGCTAAQVSAFDAAVNTGAKAVVDAAPFVCDFLDVTDPANAQAICQVIDSAGNVVATLPVIVEPIAALTMLVKSHPATTPAATASLATLKMKLKPPTTAGK